MKIRNFKLKINSRGDIALFLTLTSFALMVTGALVGSQLVKQGPRINPQAAGCIPITNVVTNPTTVSLGGTFECQVTVNLADAGSPTIACGLWGNSIYWPQNICPSSGSGFLGWSGNTARFRCTLPANANVNDNLRMVGFDFSTSCNQPSQGKTYTLNIAGQPPQPTSAPQPTTQPGQPSATPGQPTQPPAPPPTNCNSCTECIWNLRQDVVNAHDPNFWPRNTCTDKDAIINDWCGGGMGQPAIDDCNIEKANCPACSPDYTPPPSPPPESTPAPTNPPPPPAELRCYEDYSGECPDLATCVNDTTYSVPAPSLSGCTAPSICCVEKSRVEKKFTGSVTVNFSNKNSLYNGLNAVNAFLYSRTGPSAPWEIVRSHYPTNWTVKNPVFYPFVGIINGRSNRYDFAIYELPAYEYAIYSYARLTGGFPYVSGVVTNCPGGTIQDIIFTPNKFNACVFRGSAIPATGASAIFTINVDQAAPPAGTGTIKGNVTIVGPNDITIRFITLCFESDLSNRNQACDASTGTLLQKKIGTQPFTISNWTGGSVPIPSNTKGKIAAVVDYTKSDGTNGSFLSDPKINFSGGDYYWADIVRTAGKSITSPISNLNFTITIPSSGAPAADTISGNVYLKESVKNPFSSVGVYVYESDGVTYKNHKVITMSDDTSTTINSDKKGTYSFSSLTPGKKYIVIAKVIYNVEVKAEQIFQISAGYTHDFTFDLSKASGTITLPGLTNAVWEAMINDIASGIKDAVSASKFVSETFCHVPGLQKQTCDPNRGECQTFTPPCFFQDVGAI